MQLPRLKEWREFRGLTQPELAERAGMSLRSVFNYEHGGNALPNSARKLAAALGVEIGDLISEEAHPKGAAPSSQPSFNHLLEERRAKLEEVKRDIRYVLGRAEYWEQELERGRTKQYARASSAENLALLAVDEFSSFYKWLFGERAGDLQTEIERGNDIELAEEFDALIDTLVERTSRTQHMLFDNAARLAETQGQRDEIAAKLQKAAAATERAAHRSA